MQRAFFIFIMALCLQSATVGAENRALLIGAWANTPIRPTVGCTALTLI